MNDDSKTLIEIRDEIRELKRYVVGDPDTTGIVTRLDRVEQKMSMIQWFCGAFGVASIAAIVESVLGIFRNKP